MLRTLAVIAKRLMGLTTSVQTVWLLTALIMLATTARLPTVLTMSVQIAWPPMVLTV